MRNIKHILGCCLWLPVVVQAGSCEDWVAKAVSIQGTVEVRRAATPSSQWLVIHPDDTFCASDRVRVGPNSRAALLLSNDTILRLDQKTTLNFGQIAADKPSSMSLISGIAHFISRIRQTFTVDTPYVNAGIDGTEFVVTVLKDQARVTVFEGQVKAYNAQGETILTSGQSAVAQRGQAPLLKLLAQPRDAVQWALYYPMIVSADIVSMHSAAEAYRGSIEASLQSYRQGRLAAALQHLSNLPDKLDDAALAVYRAALRLNVGQVSAAQADLARAEQLDPQSAEVAATQSIIAVVQNDRDGALRLAQTAVKRAPDNASAHLALSFALQAHFDIEGAVATMKKAVAHQPGNALARARLAELYLMTGELDKALNNAQAATAIDPQLARTQSVLGFAYLTQIEVEKAQEAFKAAIERDQSDPLARLGLGLAMINQGKLDAGRREIEYAASLDPNNSLIRSYLGKAYYEEKRDKVAASQYDMAKQLDPNDPTPWYYDAIRKQTENHPVEALQALNKSMKLNNNRAVFRSKLLLDEDLAARSVDRALIYQDLGFEQLALVEGWQAVNSSHGDFSAHRFLADSYSALPRHEVARVSELLQSQLLQPININPVQPKLSESRLSFMDTLGAGATALNEYNPLFFRNQVRLQANGLTAENDTSGYEAIFSGIYNKFSYSLGRSHFETDGFHDNNGLNRDRYNAFIQAALSHKSSIQLEISRDDTTEGDRLRFDPENFFNSRAAKEDVSRIRFGFRHAFSNRSQLIASIVRQDAELDTSLLSGSFLTEQDGDGYSAEARHLFSGESIHLDTGIGYADVEEDNKDTINISNIFFTVVNENKFEDNVKHYNAYAYSNFSPNETLTLTAGLSADSFDDSDNTDNQLNPKLGFLWRLNDATMLRGAGFRVFQRTLINNQTIEPTQVGGFNQFFDIPPQTDSTNYGLALDHSFSPALYSGIEATKRKMNIKFDETDADNGTTRTSKTEWDEKQARVYMYWAPATWTSLSANYFYEDLERDRDFDAGARFTEVRTHRLPLGANFFLSSVLTAGLTATYIDQDGEFINIISSQTTSDRDSFWTVDALLDIRLPKRRGFISIGAVNLFDKSAKFQNTDPANPSFTPERTAFARINILF